MAPVIVLASPAASKRCAPSSICPQSPTSPIIFAAQRGGGALSRILPWGLADTPLFHVTHSDTAGERGYDRPGVRAQKKTTCPRRFTLCGANKRPDKGTSTVLIVRTQQCGGDIHIYTTVYHYDPKYKEHFDYKLLCKRPLYSRSAL